MNAARFLLEAFVTLDQCYARKKKNADLSVETESCIAWKLDILLSSTILVHSKYIPRTHVDCKLAERDVNITMLNSLEIYFLLILLVSV